jgi:transposase
VFNLLEGSCAVLVVKAQPAQAVPGRKPAVQEAAWRAALVPHGVWRASFIPPVAPRALRDRRRDRSPCIQERVTLIKRVQKRWEDAHIKLAAVASASMGGAGRARRAALVAGHTAPHALAAWATGRRRSTRDRLAHALDGRVKPPHRVGLTARWGQIDRLDDTMARFDAPIHALCGPFDEAVERLEPSPGVARRTAALMVAEIGTEMTRFPSAAPRASWAGVAPGPHESAGKRTSGQARKGHRVVRTPLVHAAPAAARATGPSLRAQSRRLAARRGTTRALVAVAHAMLVMA